MTETVQLHIERMIGTLADDVPRLDDDGNISIDVMPDAVAIIRDGGWDALNNVPFLADGVGRYGDMYKTTVAGVFNGLAYGVGDFVVYDGLVWSRISAGGGANPVTSVFGRGGDVVALSGDYSSFYLTRANNLSDVTNKATARSNLDLGDTNVIVNGNILIGNILTNKYDRSTLSSALGSVAITAGAGTLSLDTTRGGNELVFTAGVGLLANYTAGKIVVNNTVYTITAGSIALTASTTNGTIYIDENGIMQQSTSTAFGYMTIPLAIYTTGPLSITSITDARGMIQTARQPITDRIRVDLNTGAPATNTWVTSKVFSVKKYGSTGGRFGLTYAITAGTTNWSARIQNVTNATTIATITNLLNTGGTITYVEVAMTGAMPTGAVMELQVQRINGAAANRIFLYEGYLEY